MARVLVIAPVGLLLLVGAILLVWWLAKQAPGWVVALLGGGLVLMVGFGALLLLMVNVRSESRVPAARPSPLTDNFETSDGDGHASRPVERDGAQKDEDPERSGSHSESAASTEFPYRGRQPAGEHATSASMPDVAIFGMLIIAIVGLVLLAGFVALSIVLVKKHPGWIVLPVFGVLGLLVVVPGVSWLLYDAAHESEPILMLSAEDGTVETATGYDSPTEMQLEAGHKILAPLSGGTMREIFVRDQDYVEKNDVLLRLVNKPLQQSREEKQTAIAETDKQWNDQDDAAKKAELEKTRSAQQAELDAIDQQIAELEIKSPAAGRVEAPNLLARAMRTVGGGVGGGDWILRGGELILHIVELDPPDWVRTPSERVNGVDQRTVVIGPYRDLDKHDDELDREIQTVMQKYIQGLPNVEPGQRFRVPNRYIYDNIIRAEYIETRKYSVGRMKSKFVLLQFDNRVKKEIEEMYRQNLLERRLGFAGFGSCLVLMLIGTVYGYLKLDTQTKGYYSGRLKLAAAAAILGVVVLAVMLSRGGIIG